MNIWKFLDERVSKKSEDFILLKEILENLNGIDVKFVSPSEYKKRKGNILEKVEKNKKGISYNLYLSKKLKYGDLLYIINYLSKEFDIEKYWKIDLLLTKTKVLVAIIIRTLWEDWEKKLKGLAKKYNLDKEFIDRVMSQKLSKKPWRDFIEILKNKKTSWEAKRLFWEKDMNIAEEELREVFGKKFELTLLSWWINSLRLWMMTMMQSELEEVKKRKEKKLEKDNIVIRREDLEEREEKLRDKIGIKKWKEQLDNLRKEWDKEELSKIELKATHKILYELQKFPYQLTQENNGYLPNKILQSKEVYCVGFALLWHSFLEELEIEHNALDMSGHSALEVIIWWKNYYFDWASHKWLSEFRYEEKIGKYRKMSNGRIALSGIPEKVLLSHIYNNKWVSYSKIWNYKKAIVFYDAAITTNKSYSDGYFSKWLSLAGMGNNHEAIENFNRALELNPSNIGVYFHKWWALARSEEYEEAIKMYDISILENSKVILSYLSKWFSLAKLWRNSEAIECYDIAINIGQKKKLHLEKNERTLWIDKCMRKQSRYMKK